MSKPSIVSTTLIAGLWLVTASSAQAATLERAAEQPLEVRVVVDAEALGDEPAGVFEPELQGRIEQALVDAGYQVVEAVGADVTVRLRLSFYNEVDLDYVIATDISAGGEVIRLEDAACAQCVDDELLAKIDGIIPTIIDEVSEAPTAAATDSHSSSQTLDQHGERTPAPIGAMGGVGIGVLAGGVALTVGGAIELRRGRRDLGSQEGLTLGWEDHAPRGRALLGAGIASLVVGGALLTTDIILRSRKRKLTSEHAGVLVPALSPQTVGLSWCRRF